jgi:hypothetical protein
MKAEAATAGHRWRVDVGELKPVLPLPYYIYRNRITDTPTLEGRIGEHWCRVGVGECACAVGCEPLGCAPLAVRALVLCLPLYLRQ